MVKKKKVVFYTAVAIILVFVILLFYRYRLEMRKIISPFFMAVIIAYLLNPLVKKLVRKKIPCAAAILLIYLLFSIGLVVATIFVVPELINNTKELMVTLPDITARYQSMFDSFISMIKSSNWPSDIKSAIFREIHNGAVIAESYIADALKKSLVTFIETVTMLFDLILSMIIAYYFIKDSEFFKASALSLTPRRWRNWLINTGRDINAILSNFIQGQLLTALIVGILEVIGLYIVKSRYPLVLGLIGGTANIIPYFGPIIGAIPAVAVALMDSPLKAVWVALVFTIVQQIDNSFISPKIIEGRLGLHPVSTILAVLVGGEFFGIVGMLVSVPVMAIIKVILKRSVEAIV